MGYSRRPGFNDEDVYVARVSHSGVVLDPDGILVADGRWRRTSARIAWGQSRYMVAWSDAQNPTWDVRAARVGTSGTVLDPGGISVLARPTHDLADAVVWQNDHFLVPCERGLAEFLQAKHRRLRISLMANSGSCAVSGFDYDGRRVRSLCRCGASRAVSPSSTTRSRLWGRDRSTFLAHRCASSTLDRAAPDEGDYDVSVEQAQQIVPGTVDVGNRCDDCVTTLELRQ